MKHKTEYSFTTLVSAKKLQSYLRRLSENVFGKREDLSDLQTDWRGESGKQAEELNG